MALSLNDPQGLYNYLNNLDLYQKDDNFYRSMGVGFDRGRQDAIDFMAKYRQNNPSPMDLAGSLQQMQVQANQPAIQTLQSQGTSLKDAYSSLLNSVMQSGSAAQNFTIGGANAGLAARGITGDSQLAQQTIGSALLPVTAQQNSAISQIGMGSAQDLNTLAGQIAALQQGNVPGAIQAAPQFAGLSALPAQIALTRAQAQAAPYVPISQGGFLFGPSGQAAGGGTLINPLLMALKQMGINISG